MTAGGVKALAASAVIAVSLVVAACASGSGTDDTPLDADLSERIDAAGPAVGAFEGLTAIEVTVGDERLMVVVADEPRERTEGLRGRTHLEHYDGMLFVHEGDTTTGFTMRGVDEPLALAFYDADGERVGGHDMEPCPDRLDCPTYRPEIPWRYALETRPDELPEGALGAGP